MSSEIDTKCTPFVMQGYDNTLTTRLQTSYRLTKWEVPRNCLPPRHRSAEKQAAIRTQVNKLLELGVIEESQASEWSQAHPVPKGDGQWRLECMRKQKRRQLWKN